MLTTTTTTTTTTIATAAATIIIYQSLSITITTTASIHRPRTVAVPAITSHYRCRTGPQRQNPYHRRSVRYTQTQPSIISAVHPTPYVSAKLQSHSVRGPIHDITHIPAHTLSLGPDQQQK